MGYHIVIDHEVDQTIIRDQGVDRITTIDQ